MDPNEDTPEEPVETSIVPEVLDDEPVETDTEETAETTEHDDDSDETEDGDASRRSRIGRFARRLIDRKEIASDTRELLGSVLATSDKAKTEAVRMAAKEVRSYLDALALKDDVKALLTSYSLEISISLKPLADALDEPEAESE